MKILAISDKVMDVLYSPTINGNFGDVDLVVSCGDLPFYYLEYIISSLNVPGYFVYGNHDLNVTHSIDGPVARHPPGWVNLDGHSVCDKGLILAGLEGSLRYRPDGVHQYTQTEARWKALQLGIRLVMNRIQYGRYLDVLVTHSPPFGIHDGPDHPHTGFKAYLTLMERLRPRFLFHGHKHVYNNEPTWTKYFNTEVINVYPYRVVEIDE